MWNQVIIETNPKYSLVQENIRGVGKTKVTYMVVSTVLGGVYTRSGTANPPDAAWARRKDCYIGVSFRSRASNPLLPSPNIIANYDILFNMSSGLVTVTGTHTEYPWHELYISEIGFARRFTPSRFATPANLRSGATRSVSGSYWIAKGCS
jgi:hypothetical protein